MLMSLMLKHHYLWRYTQPSLFLQKSKRIHVTWNLDMTKSLSLHQISYVAGATLLAFNLNWNEKV